MLPFCFFLCFLALASGETRTTQQILEDFVKSKEKIVSRLAAAAEKAYSERPLHLQQCVCSRHSCSNDLGKNADCSFEFGSVPSCGGCGGSLLDNTTSSIRVAPGTDPKNLTAQVKESLCTFSAMEPEFRKVKEDTWSYIGAVDGTIRVHPFRNRIRTPDGDKLFQGCQSFDPRIRPWYIAASTGPKDVVLLIDTSGSMAGPVDSPRWDLTREALLLLLDTFTPADFVNIVTFASNAKPLLKGDPLQPANKKNRDKLKKGVKKVFVNGGTDFNRGFNEAFDLLARASEERTVPTTSTCTKLIIFLTDGNDCSTSSTPSQCSLSREEGPERLMANIEEHQASLEKATGGRALIFTFSMGTDADDSIPRQIACANDGTWSFFEDGDDPLLKLNSYSTFLAAARYPGRVTWAEPFLDADGLGVITSVSKAIYSPKGKKGTNGVQIGVVGHDTRLEELDVGDVRGEDVVAELTRLSKTCDDLKLKPCQLQVQRDGSVDHATCPDRLPKKKCYEFSRRWYSRIDTPKDWSSAQKECKSKGGNLVSILSDEHLAFLAAMAAPRGSWVGAKRRTFSDMYDWVDKTVASIGPDSAFWGRKEPLDIETGEECVTVDPRGLSQNLADQVCFNKLSFICEYRSKPKFCKKSIALVDPSSHFEIPPLSQCRNEEDILSQTRPVAGARTIDSADVLCSLGKEKPMKELVCCDGCPEKAKEPITEFFKDVRSGQGCLGCSRG